MSTSVESNRLGADESKERLPATPRPWRGSQPPCRGDAGRYDREPPRFLLREVELGRTGGASSASPMQVGMLAEIIMF